MSREVHCIRCAKGLGSSGSSTAGRYGQDTASIVLIYQEPELMLTLPSNFSDTLGKPISKGDKKGLENCKFMHSGRICSYTEFFRSLVLEPEMIWDVKYLCVLEFWLKWKGLSYGWADRDGEGPAKVT